MNYWQEAVSCALDEAGVTATDDQINQIARSIEISHDCYGMAHGHDCIPNPTVLENEKLKKELNVERSKVGCPECDGRGSITTSWGTTGRSCTSRCDRCNGEGKIKQ